MKVLALIFLMIVIPYSTTIVASKDNFSFEAQDIYELSSGQLVIVGLIKSGEIRKNEKLKFIINDVETLVTIDKMEVFAKPNQMDIGFKNDYVAFTISGLTKSQVKKGMTITKQEV